MAWAKSPFGVSGGETVHTAAFGMFEIGQAQEWIWNCCAFFLNFASASWTVASMPPINDQSGAGTIGSELPVIRPKRALPITKQLKGQTRMRPTPGLFLHGTLLCSRPHAGVRNSKLAVFVLRELELGGPRLGKRISYPTRKHRIAGPPLSNSTSR